jgi:hypothetical protein
MLGGSQHSSLMLLTISNALLALLWLCSPDGDTLLRDDDQVYVLASANDLPCAQH